MCNADIDNLNPFTRINVENRPLIILDDNTKQRTESIIRPATSLTLPELEKSIKIEIPGTFADVYSATIQKFSSNSERDLKKARLFS